PIQREKRAGLRAFRKEPRESEYVRSLINSLDAYLFGRHVSYGAHCHSGISIDSARGDLGLWLVAISLRQLCQTKIEYLHSAIFSDEDIVGLQVAMDNSFVM